MPNSTLHAKSKIALVEAEWAHFTTARSEHAARRVMAAHLLLRYALIVCLFFVPVKGTAALFAYAQKSGMQRQPVCAIHRRAAVDLPGHVALRVLQVEVLRTIVLHYKFTTFSPTLQPYIHFPATFSSLFRRT